MTKFLASLLIAAAMVAPVQAAQLTIRAYGPAYGSRLNPVPNAKIIQVDPDEIIPGPLYACARKNCTFQTK